jgi:hypothetical protein
MNYPFDKFNYFADLIINNLEGGYYHPDFYINGAKTMKGGYIPAAAFKTKKADYISSGETLFGLDRHAGWNMWYKSKRIKSDPRANLPYIYSSSSIFWDNDAKEFWTTLDKVDARHNWAHEYQGGPLRPRLKELAIKMMYQYFLRSVWSKLDEKGKALVLKDNQLALNYIYSAWNGIAYSNYYNSIFNNEIAKNNFDSTDINNKILNARANSKSPLIRDSATKIKRIYPKLKDQKNTNTVVVKKKTTNNLLLGGLVPILIILIIFRKKIFK